MIALRKRWGMDVLRCSTSGAADRRRNTWACWGLSRPNIFGGRSDSLPVSFDESDHADALCRIWACVLALPSCLFAICCFCEISESRCCLIMDVSLALAHRLDKLCTSPSKCSAVCSSSQFRDNNSARSLIARKDLGDAWTLFNIGRGELCWVAFFSLTVTMRSHDSVSL